VVVVVVVVVVVAIANIGAQAGKESELMLAEGRTGNGKSKVRPIRT
jgi:hypothetical protein